MMCPTKGPGFAGEGLGRQAGICPFCCSEPEVCSHRVPVCNHRSQSLALKQGPASDTCRAPGAEAETQQSSGRTAGAHSEGWQGQPHGAVPCFPHPRYLLGEPRSARLTMRCCCGEYSHWKAVSVLSSIRNRPSLTYLKITTRQTEIFISAGWEREMQDTGSNWLRNAA